MMSEGSEVYSRYPVLADHDIFAVLVAAVKIFNSMF